MAKFKDREAKEAPYIAHNKDVLSVCSGSFYIKGRNIHEPCKNREKCQKYAKYKNAKGDAPEVGFYYVDSFRKCDLWKKMELQAELALRIAIYNILYVNDLACACVIDMKDKVKNQDKETQKIYGALLKRQWIYEKEMVKILGDQINFCADVNSEMDDSVQTKLCDLYDAIYSYLQDNGVQNYGFIAYAELAYTIIGYSILSIDKRIEECRKYNKDVVNLQRYKLIGMLDVSKNLCNWLGRKCNGLNLNDCQEIKDAYHELDKVLTNIRVIESAILKAEERQSVV